MKALFIAVLFVLSILAGSAFCDTWTSITGGATLGTTIKLEAHTDYGGTLGGFPAGILVYGASTDPHNATNSLTIMGNANGTAGSGLVLGYYSQANKLWLPGLELYNVAANYSNLVLMKDGGKVGIGTDSPDYPLSVKTNNGDFSIVGTNGTTKVGIGTYYKNGEGYFGTITNNPLLIATNNSIQMALSTNGNVGIGIESPATKLDVSGIIASRGSDSALYITPVPGGQMRLKTNGANQWLSFADGAGGTDIMAIKSNSVCIGTTTSQTGSILTVKGSGYFTGIITTGSSRTLKNDIQDLSEDEALAALKELQPVKFRYNADKDNTVRLGFIAEDVPDLVAERDRKSLSDMNFVALAITVIKKQQEDIEALQKEIVELKKQSQ